ncbi:interactor of HORMAD1 protein 1 [Lepus europaeus]|uniref:interactor of HORMAD1 protein 1 n=1 Tax=Lepus europaeus TaxID=9983 RepID=UPI002B4A67BF|nr:interactor of HORMAD1 protein 1 [Lepus europaeus]
MNFNVWNIKEMLSIPSGSGNTKASVSNNNQTDYSSLSDSQFLFGSQFCPENSETLSAPLDFGAQLRQQKQSQQNSLDSEPSIFTKYQTKPQLFGGNAKDGDLFPLPLPVGKSKGLLEQFEEKKKTAKDKCDSETLYNFVSNVRESIHKLQTSVEKSEEHLTLRSQSILDSLETVAKTLQETARTQSDLVFEAVQEKGNTEQAILEMQKKFEAKQAEILEMKSNLKHLEVLVAQQSKDFQQLCEQLGQLNVPSVLAELKRWISVPQVSRHVRDSTAQTSPLLARDLSFTRQEQYASEDPMTWQAQGLPGAGTPSRGSSQPGKFDVWGEAAKNGALQEEAALPGAQPREGNGCAKDQAMQPHSNNQGVRKSHPENPGSHIPGYRVPGDRDQVSQGASQLTSLDSNTFATSIKNAYPKYQTKSMSSSDPCEQVVTEQKGGAVERGGKGMRQQTRGACRGRPTARKQEQAPGATRAFRSKYQSPQPPGSVPQSAPRGQQEPLTHVQPLHGVRSPSKPVRAVLRGTVMPTKTARAARRSCLQFSRFSSPDNSLLSGSSQGDHQMSWFSDLSLGRSEPPPCKEPGKHFLYDLGFDSSDDGF